eukprot:5992593-Amphidinium_carterae.1
MKGHQPAQPFTCAALSQPNIKLAHHTNDKDNDNHNENSNRNNDNEKLENWSRHEGLIMCALAVPFWKVPVYLMKGVIPDQ